MYTDATVKVFAAYMQSQPARIEYCVLAAIIDPSRHDAIRNDLHSDLDKIIDFLLGRRRAGE